MASFRFNVIDADGTVSFLAPAYALKMVAAACSRGVAELPSLIDGIGEFDPSLATDLRDALDRRDDVGTRFEEFDPVTPFRVGNDETRAAAQEPGSAGLIVVNLSEKRIVQVQNTYADLKRRDRGRMRRNGRPLRLMYHYDLPEEWRIVP